MRWTQNLYSVIHSSRWLSSRCGTVVALKLLVFVVAGFSQNQMDLLPLEKAVSLALESNSLVKAAEYGVEAASKQVQFAFSGYLPKVTFDHTATRGNNPVYVFGTLLTQRRFAQANFALNSLNNPAPLTNFQNKISVSQSFFDGGRTRKAVAQSRIGKEISTEELEKTKAELIFRV
jgi:outer membrane protein TolC